MYAYRIIGIIEDKKYANLLLEIIKKEKIDASTFWVGWSLLILQSNLDTADSLFTLIINKRMSGSHFLFPLYSQLLDKKKLYNVVLKYLDSKEIKTQLYTVRLCAFLEKDEIIESYLKSIIKTTSKEPIKGFAISCLGYLNGGNLLELLTPSLKAKKLRKYVLRAFANSPTKEDRGFFYNLIKSNKILDKDILYALLKSNRKENIKTWFTLLKDGKKIPSGYFFSIYYHPLIQKDPSLISELYNVIENSQHHPYLQHLIWGLRERNDKKSIQIVKNHLNHTDKNVRYWAKKILKKKK